MKVGDGGNIPHLKAKTARQRQHAKLALCSFVGAYNGAVSWAQVRLLTAPPGSMPGRDPRRPPLSERLRLEPDDCWDPVPTQLLQKCAPCCAVVM
jgi:hypothetical protein